MVLRCKLSASLDPERDLFSPGSETCSTRHVVPFAYEDGWFTTVAASPSGSGGLCQDFQPDDGILKPREVSDRGVMSSFLKASSGLIWEGAGTHSATCRLAQALRKTVTGIVRGPQTSAGGHPITYTIWPHVGPWVRPNKAGEYQLEAEYFYDGLKPTTYRLYVTAKVTGPGQQPFLVSEAEVKLDPNTQAMANFDVSEADIAAGLDPDTRKGLKLGKQFFLPNVDRLVEKAPPQSAEAPLLQRMKWDRTSVEDRRDELAWSGYDQHRESWITEQMDANALSEEEASDAFDEYWQDQLDHWEAKSSWRYDATGRKLGTDGNPIDGSTPFSGAETEAMYRKYWTEQYIKTNGSSPAEALEAYRKSRYMTSEE